MGGVKYYLRIEILASYLSIPVPAEEFEKPLAVLSRDSAAAITSITGPAGLYSVPVPPTGY